MKILVINGSPKGKNSITLQTALYIEKHFPAHTFQYLHVGQRIKAYEKDFTPCAEALAQADLLLFCYPVYTFLVPAQLHRFIELMKEHNVDVAGKIASQISTSKHFYDVTAHRFIQDNCDDMGLRYIRGLSADMEDLLSDAGRKQALDFFRFVCFGIGKDLYEPAFYRPAADRSEETAAPAPTENAAEEPTAAIRKSGKIVIVSDSGNDRSGELAAMIKQFKAKSDRAVQVEDLADFPFSGGCLGCFHCAAGGKCVYKDGFDQYLRQKIQTADAIVYAFTVRDHSMGSRMKMFDDRQFCNGHRTVTMGKPVGYLIGGSLNREPNLRMLIESRAEAGGNFLAGVACSGKEQAEGINRLLQTLDYALENDYQPPADFYGVGGMKIFRDLIYQMQGLMKEDHRFYKEHGFYDFPQKRKGRLAGMYLVGGMMTNKALSKKMGGKMTDGMLLPYRIAIETDGKKDAKKAFEIMKASMKK